MEISLSLKVLGSKELRDQISKDIDDLIDLAKQRKLRPVILTVGNIFLESGTVQTIIADLRIMDWDKEVDRNHCIISEIFNNKKLIFLQDCEEKSGFIGKDDEKRLNIFLDPDEPYLCLTCADPKNKVSKSDQIATADGYLYYKIKFKPEETLVDFVVEKFN